MYSYLVSFLLYTSFLIAGFEEMLDIGVILMLSLEAEDNLLLSLLYFGRPFT